MSNGPRLSMMLDMRITQTLGMHLAPLMTPVLRRSRDQRPADDDEDEMPWRDPSGRRTNS